MTNQELTYKLMVIGFPVLWSILTVIGVFVAKALLSMAKNINEINVAMQGLIAKHDGLEQRVNKIENKIFNC